MKKIKNMSLVTLIIISFNSSMYGSNNESNDEFTEMQEFYYERGFKDAAKEYYLKGWKNHEKAILKKLKAYEKKIQAYEASKYLLKNGYITYPESYRIKNPDGSYKTVITKPKIEKPLRVQDLFLLPELEEDLNSEITKDLEKKNINKKNINNGYYLPNSHISKSNIPTSINSLPAKSDITFNKNIKVLNLVNSLNLKHLEMPQKIKVYFNNNSERANFCYELTGDRECQ